MQATYSQLRQIFLIFGACFTLILPLNGFAAAMDSYLDWCGEEQPYFHCDEVKNICSQTASVSIPVADKPTEKDKQILRECSSNQLYYGYGNPPDPINARKCAYLEFESSNTIDESFYGSSILMMVYANGEGVERNLDLALKFACEDGGGQIVEYEGHILHLEQLRNNNVATSEKFDFCDDTQSRLMMGRCADRDAQISSAEREIEFSKLLLSWNERQRSEFEKFRTVWKSYLAVSIEEIDYNGAMSVPDGIHAKSKKQDDLLWSLQNFEQGKFPSFNEGAFEQTDRELNQIYKKIQSAREDDAIEFSWGSVTKENIKIVQRAWLKYRDAWVVFAKQKYPSVSTASWKTWLTRERVEQLNSFFENPTN